MDEESSRDIALVVDDSPEALRLLTDALDAAGMTVMVALDGASALRICGRVTPDIVLLDAVMPGMDGFETCRRMKRDARLAHVPIVFMTGLSETEHVVRGFEAGGVDYVGKPIVVAQMLARVRAHLSNARMTQSARNALDVSGRFLLAVDDKGRLLWATPRAHALLTPPGAETDDEADRLPPLARDWLAVARLATGSEAPAVHCAPDGNSLLYFLGALGPAEFLLRIARAAQPDNPANLGRSLGLTRREGEVLSWLSKGKSNRDIAEILGLSPRTIDKHLEQIYAKLGVENRSAATAVAINKANDANSSS